MARHQLKASQLPKILATGIGGDGTVKKDHHDGGGLFLAVNTKVRRGLWRLRYQQPGTGKYTKLAGGLGECFLSKDTDTVLGMTLEQARRKAEEILAGLVGEQRIDPNVAARENKAKQEAAAAAAAAEAADRAQRAKEGRGAKDSFRDCADRAFAAKKGILKFRTIAKYLDVLKRHVYPRFGDKHINEVTAQDIYEMQEDLKGRGMNTTMVHCRSACFKVFEWAIHPKVGLRTAANPVFSDADMWLALPKPKPQAAVTREDDIRDLILAIEAPFYNTAPNTQPLASVTRCMQFTMLTAQRHENVRTARWDEITINADGTGRWVIPKEKMKGRLTKLHEMKDHVVHLSTQAVALLEKQRAAYPGSVWCFPGRKEGLPISHTAMTQRFKKIGYRGKQTVHGMRATMRTAAKRYLKIKPVLLEKVLAHKDASQGLEFHAQVSRMMDGGMGNTYERDDDIYEDDEDQLAMEARDAQVMQAWGNWIESLRRPQLRLAA